MTRPLRVAVVTRSVYPLHGLGGLERSVYDLVRYLAAAGVEVTLVTRTPAKPSSPDAIDPRITSMFVPYRTFPFAGRRGTTVIDRTTAYPLFGEHAGKAAWALVEHGEVDLVHGFGASVLGYARRRSHSKAPLVLNPQGLEEFGATDPSRARLKRAAYLPLRTAVLTCARAADCVIATDRALEPTVRSHLKLPADRIRTIPNALDLTIVDRLATPADGARLRAAAGIAPNDVVLLSVGRIEENKGFQVLAAALAAVKAHSGLEADGRWTWVVVGDGPFRPRLVQAVEAAGVQDRLLLAGRLPDAELHAWYEAASLFIHPTLYEGSSLVTLEAMAHRLAVVATRAGGLPDKIRPGVNGWLVSPGDPSSLAAAISGALGDMGRLAALGRAGRQIVEQEFSWGVTGAATMQLYEDLLR